MSTNSYCLFAIPASSSSGVGEIGTIPSFHELIECCWDLGIPVIRESSSGACDYAFKRCSSRVISRAISFIHPSVFVADPNEHDIFWV